MIALTVSTVCYYLVFRNELGTLARRQPVSDAAQPSEEAVRQGFGQLAIPAWITAVYVAFLIWTVVNSHYPVVFLGGFLFFLGFDRATAAYSVQADYRTPLLVGFFLAGLVVHGGLQAWWIAPVLASL